MSEARTIQIFLPFGNPRGVRIAEITSRTVQVILVPRANLEQASERLELCNPGVYFLVGDSGDSANLQVYVGEAEDCLVRIKQHHRQKDFWTAALVAISKTQYFTKTHVKFLEWHCHTAIAAAGRFSLENASIPAKPYVPESMEADLKDNFDTLRILLGTLGYPLFEELKAPQRSPLLRCQGKDASATGDYSEEGLVVYTGSTANLTEAPSAGSWLAGLRAQLIESGVLVRDGNVYRFARDHAFSSPSAAAATVLARRANGWLEWKYADGRTLDQAVRQASDGTER